VAIAGSALRCGRGVSPDRHYTRLRGLSGLCRGAVPAIEETVELLGRLNREWSPHQRADILAAFQLGLYSALPTGSYPPCYPLE
jgi:hypothetical protein